MDKAIFLDRDGVLIKNEKEHVHKIEDFELYPDVVNGLRELKDYKLFVVTNQPGPANAISTNEQSNILNNCEKQLIILAGKFGNRIAALAPKWPKPMINIKGQPLLERQVEFFK